MDLVQPIYQDENFEIAYSWACRQRRNAGANHSIWDVRFHWPRVKKTLQEQLIHRKIHLSPLKRYCIEGSVLDCWDTKDAILLKAVALQRQQPLQIKMSSHCTHLKGHGGVQKTVAAVREAVQHYKFILKAAAFLLCQY